MSFIVIRATRDGRASRACQDMVEARRVAQEWAAGGCHVQVIDTTGRPPGPDPYLDADPGVRG